MESLLLGATVVDLAAVVALAWVVVRGARERELALATQREALQRLRAELTHLLEEAERRARRLEQAVGGGDEGRSARRGAPASPASAPVASSPDLAELRLRRELELSLGTGRLA